MLCFFAVTRAICYDPPQDYAGDERGESVKIEVGQKWRRKKDGAIVVLTAVQHFGNSTYDDVEVKGENGRKRWIFMAYLVVAYEPVVEGGK